MFNNAIFRPLPPRDIEEKGRRPSLFLHDFAFGMAVSCESGDDAGAGIDAPDAIVNLIGDVEISNMVKSDPARVDFGFGCRTAVATVALLARSRNPRDKAGFGVDSPDRMCHVFDNEDVALCIDGDAERIAKTCTGCWPPVTGGIRRSIARYSRDFFRFKIDAPDAVIVIVGNMQVFGTVESERCRPIETRVEHQAAVP